MLHRQLDPPCIAIRCCDGVEISRFLDSDAWLFECSPESDPTSLSQPRGFGEGVGGRGCWRPLCLTRRETCCLGMSPGR